MTTKKAKQSAAKGANNSAQPKARVQPPKPKKPAFASRFVGIDTHLTERNGSTERVYGLAVERPAGKKLAEDISKHCIQLDAEDYDVISIVPLTSGRAAAASVEVAQQQYGRTYSRDETVQETDYWGRIANRTKTKHYLDTNIGYSVTDGVVITAKLRKQ